jgi:hypothetical protein|tara:strand:+ start:82 stop:1134 length:1053 start_codon:yes stop_codon:yes gene_type:complete
MSINIVQAQGLSTQKTIAVYKQMTVVTSFLQSFFVPKESMTRYVSTEVKRGLEKVASQVHEYSDGNRNVFTATTVKVFKPAFYHEYLTANEYQLYDQVITSLSNGDSTFFLDMVQEHAEQLMLLQNKIERAVEIMCAQALETGIVTMLDGADINFGRKAASVVAYNAANDFSVGTVSPYDVFEAGCQFIRQTGKAQGGVFNAIMGTDAMAAFLNNTIVKERNDIRNINLDMLRTPQRLAVGHYLHGEITVGSNTVRLITYPEYYDNDSNVSTAYIDPKKFILMPEQTNFVLAYGAVPQLIEDNGTIPQKGRYLIQEFKDRKEGKHTIHIKAAPLPVTVDIDKIYTIQVLS